eukprot:3193146-Ditylum_brightwellii.AAC.1
MKAAGWTRHIGTDFPRKVFLWLVESKINMKEKLLTTYFARKSAATALADIGIFMTNLKCEGRWNLKKVAEGYLENSKSQKNKQMNMLDTAVGVINTIRNQT